MGVLSLPASPLRVLRCSEEEKVVTVFLDIVSSWLTWASACTFMATCTHMHVCHTHANTSCWGHTFALRQHTRAQRAQAQRSSRGHVHTLSHRARPGGGTPPWSIPWG